MFKNFLNRNQPTPPPEEDLDKKLQTTINELENKSFKLHSQIMGLGDVLTDAKKALMNERADIVHQITILKEQQEAPKEQKALEAINKLFKERRYILKINGKEVKAKNGLLTVTFRPCKHKMTLPIAELFRYRTNIPNALTLLPQLQGSFNSKATLTKPLNCLECRKKHPNTLHGQEVTIGTAHITLSIF